MLPLTLNVLLAVAFGHVMKLATVQRANLLWVGAFNYIAGSAVCLAIAVAQPPQRAVAFTIVTGAWAGVCYLVSLLFYFAAVRRLGMGLATSAVRISVALPVAASLLIWHEALQPAQAVGLALVALAMLLLGSGSHGPTRDGMAQLFGLIIPLFLITGLGQLAARIYSGGAPAANAYLYIGSIFAGAAASALLALALRPVRPTRRDVGLGLMLGAANALNNLGLLWALRQLPSAIVFSVSSAASVALAALTGILIWRERLSRPAGIAVLSALIAVVLLTR
jgi:drug/metabolite transporter (DMT)-like permease